MTLSENFNTSYESDDDNDPLLLMPEETKGILMKAKKAGKNILRFPKRVMKGKNVEKSNDINDFIDNLEID